MNKNYPLTTTVGSYPVPLWLRNFSTKESLQDAIKVIFKTQELAGIDLVVDGELSRWDINHAETNGMIDYFIRPMTGIRTSLTRKEIEDFRKKSGMGYRKEPAGLVVDKLGHGTLNLSKDFEFVAPFTTKPLKFTVTSPYMLAKVLTNQYYRTFEELIFALADILAEQVDGINADVIQVDEANITGSPQDGKIAAKAINKVLNSIKKEKAVHLCFGNYGGQTVQTGTYKKLIDFMNLLECDHLVMEIARRPKSDEIMLKELRPETGIGLGVIDIKDNQVESPETIASRIEEVAKLVGQDRIKYVHPDCGFWMLPRSVADAKMNVLVKGRDLFAGKK